jgi:hypothetical protein
VTNTCSQARYRPAGSSDSVKTRRLYACYCEPLEYKIICTTDPIVINIVLLFAKYEEMLCQKDREEHVKGFEVVWENGAGSCGECCTVSLCRRGKASTHTGRRPIRQHASVI